MDVPASRRHRSCIRCTGCPPRPQSCAKEFAMASTILALYEDRKTGVLAARDLLDHGFEIDDVNILSGGDAVPNWEMLDPTEPQKDAVVKGAGIGAAVGAVGGIIASLTAFAVPGV